MQIVEALRSEESTGMSNSATKTGPNGRLAGGRATLRWVQLGLHAVLGIAAIGAGQAFVRDPSGSALGMTTDYLAGSPFPDFRFPGLFLAVVIGGANLVSALALWRRHALAPYSSLATGALLVLWVAVQTTIIGFRQWSQAIWPIIFTAVALLGVFLVRDNSSDRDGTTGN